MPDFDVNEYLSQQASDIAKKHQAKPKKKLDKPGEVGTFDTGAYGINRPNTTAGFEMKGKGAADATLVGPRPRRPDRIIQEEQKKPI